MSLDIHLVPDACPHCGRGDEGYSANITHNLTRMAAHAGLYKPLWRPEENGITHARDLINPLVCGIRKMRDYPDRFRKYDSPNGWGLYQHFLPWLERLLEACRENPGAAVQVSV